MLSQVMFGRQARMPIDFNTANTYSLEEKIMEYDDAEDEEEDDRVVKRQRIEEDVKRNIAVAQVILVLCVTTH